MRRTAVAILAVVLLACSSGAQQAPVTTGAAASGLPTAGPATPSPRPTTTTTTTTPVAAEDLSTAELIETLRDPDQPRRVDIVEELATRDGRAAASALVRASTDREQRVALAAITALGTRGGREALAGLLALTKPADVPYDGDEAGIERYTAAIAGVGQIGGNKAVLRLLRIWAVDTTPVPVSAAVSQAVAKLTKDDVKALAAAFARGDNEIRSYATAVLARIRGRAAIALVISALADEDIFVRDAAMSGLKLRFGDDATPLLAYLKSPDTVQVYLALIKLGQDGTEGALVDALNTFGYQQMAVDYLNAGNQTLEDAATAWATAHGYIVYTTPGAAEVVWGG